MIQEYTIRKSAQNPQGEHNERNEGMENMEPMCIPGRVHGMQLQ